MFFSECPSIRCGLGHDPTLFQVLTTFLGLVERINISIPAQTEILFNGKLTYFLEIQAGMVMDQPLPLSQASIIWVGSAAWDRGDLEFGSDNPSIMKAI